MSLWYLHHHHHHVVSWGSQSLWKRDFNKQRKWVIAVLWALKDRRVEQAEIKTKQAAGFNSSCTVNSRYFVQFCPSMSFFMTHYIPRSRMVHVRHMAKRKYSPTDQRSCCGWGMCYVSDCTQKSCSSSETSSSSHQHKLTVTKHTTVCWKLFSAHPNMWHTDILLPLILSLLYKSRHFTTWRYITFSLWVWGKQRQ